MGVWPALRISERRPALAGTSAIRMLRQFWRSVQVALSGIVIGVVMILHVGLKATNGDPHAVWRILSREWTVSIRQAYYRRVLDSGTQFERCRAASELSRETSPTPETIQRLIDAMDERDILVRTAVVEAIGGFGPLARVATEPLLRRLKTDTDTRQSIVYSLMRIGPRRGRERQFFDTLFEESQRDWLFLPFGNARAWPVEKHLVALAGEPQYAFRVAALYGLRGLGPRGCEAGPLLKRILDDYGHQPRDVLSAAIVASHEVGRHAAEVVDSLKAIVEVEPSNSALRSEVETAIQEINRPQRWPDT